MQLALVLLAREDLTRRFNELDRNSAVQDLFNRLGMAESRAASSFDEVRAELSEIRSERATLARYMEQPVPPECVSLQKETRELRLETRALREALERVTEQTRLHEHRLVELTDTVGDIHASFQRLVDDDLVRKAEQTSLAESLTRVRKDLKALANASARPAEVGSGTAANSRATSPDPVPPRPTNAVRLPRRLFPLTFQRR